MKRLTQIVLVGIFLLAVVSTAVAQPAAPPVGRPALQPVVRLGNFTEVANDLFMHIIATSDIRYATNENMDFEKRIRDQATDRSAKQHRPAGDGWGSVVVRGALWGGCAVPEKPDVSAAVRATVRSSMATSLTAAPIREPGRYRRVWP